MKADVKELWVTALRSGDYTQTTGALQDRKGFCCLGVLCDLAIKAGIEVTKGPSELGTAFSFDGYSGTLPPSVRHWAELTDSNPVMFGPVGMGGALAVLNDGGRDFNQIADLIEENL